jgi:hypothetical protein
MLEMSGLDLKYGKIASSMGKVGWLDINDGAVM